VNGGEAMRPGRLPTLAPAIKGVRPLGHMTTLMSHFPLIQHISCDTDDNPSPFAQAYRNWNLVAFDSQFNLLLSRQSHELENSPLADLVILVERVANEWIYSLSTTTG
jgi:hypothetical protein